MTTSSTDPFMLSAYKKHDFHRFLWVIIPFLIFIFSACGEAADTSGLSGGYVLKSVEEEGMLLPAEAVEEMDLHLQLEPGGRGSVLRGADEGSLSWSVEGELLTVRLGTTTLTGSLEECDLVLQPMNSSEVLHFAMEESATGVAQESDEGRKAFSFHEDWYGWWKIEQVEGEMPVTWYDCCAAFIHNDDGTLLLIIWDEDSSREDPLAEILLEDTDGGELASISGYFLYDSVEAGEWCFSIPESELFLEDRRHEGNALTFSYSIYLRPWGAEWGDLSAEQLPFYYEDWYLPLIHEHEPMPHRIPWQKIEEERAA